MDNIQTSLLKVETFSKKSQASQLLLKTGDVVVALNNEIYSKGDNTLVDDLNFYKKEEKKTLITIYRNNSFFDILVFGSLGCKFIPTTEEETNRISQEFSKKKIYDIDELNEYIAMRDTRNNYEIINKFKSIMAGIFPPLWLAYHNSWWLLGMFSILSFLLLSINFWLFIFGWICVSLYCYKGNAQLLISFAILSGKNYSMIFCAKNIEEAQIIIRSINEKSKFKYTKLEDPKIEEAEEDENKENKNNISESKEALV